MFSHELQQLGFSDKEAAAYTLLLQLGPSAASTLARRTNIKRTSMYDVLNTLLEKNLINTFKQGDHSYFFVDDVNKIYYQEKEKLQTAKNFLRKIKTQQNLNPGIQVHYYKGWEGFRELYEDILRFKPAELLGWMNLDLFYKGIPADREAEWTKERIQKKIYVRLLLQDSPLTRVFKSEDSVSNRETRLIPFEFSFQPSCMLYDGYITFFDPGPEITGIRIHNPALFEMQKQIFEMNWKGFGAL
ncbi:MAG: Transcriptional regulator, TrmB [uncultured bacterium]|nr:MAG: Transcriptional regulator, TrmB [uncultured bacterium]